jgi:nucleoside-diphosphate-sugar epimerase
VDTIKGKKIAIIGGAGFIGHNMALKMAAQGASVSVVDSLAVNNYFHFREKVNLIPDADLYLKIIKQRMDLLENAKIPMHLVDSRDYHKLTETITQIKPEIVIHLAAVSNANVSNKDPYSTFDHSLRTLENMLDISRGTSSSVKHFIYFSSSMIYGNFTSGAVTEETPCEPLGIYGALKFGGEKMVIAYNQVFDLPYTIVRPSALYGPRCVSRRVGQIFIENAMKGLEISINGNGQDRLDFTFIDDLVAGVINVIENKNSINQTFNLTYGQSRSIAEMAEIMKEHFPELSIKYLPKDKLTPDRGTLSVEKAREMIGYNPQFPLEKGFVDYVNWYKSIWDEAKAE